MFEFLADPHNIPLWNYAITGVEVLTSGPVAVGTLIRQSRSLPRPGQEVLEVTEFQPPNTLVLRGTLGPLSGSLSYRLEAVQGGTQIVNSADLHAAGLLRLLAPISTNRLGSAVAQNLEKLKQVLERSE